MIIRIYTLILFTVFMFLNINVNGQNTDNLFDRLQGIDNGNFKFYNVDGYEISTLKMFGRFSKKNIPKKYKKLKIKEEDLNDADTSISLPNYFTHNTEKIDDGIILNSSYYFIKTQEKEITAVTFKSFNDIDIAFQRRFIALVLNQKIPSSIYSSRSSQNINFGGRTIKLGGNCGFRNVNNIQCSGYGQINWSVCKSMEISQRVIDSHLKMTELRENGKIISEELVDVIFEESDVKARKVIFDFTGVTSALVGMTGGKTLTIYYVIAPVRGNYISCVMSFWNNDQINPSGLAPLLEEVMELKQ